LVLGHQINANRPISTSSTMGANKTVVGRRQMPGYRRSEKSHVAQYVCINTDDRIGRNNSATLGVVGVADRGAGL
jgi:hypothetical protein